MDLSFIEELYDESIAVLGAPLEHALCDRRVLIPRSALPGHMDPLNRAIHLDELDRLAAAGWFKWLPEERAGEAEPGVPLYVPDRIDLFLRLRSRGWTDDELR